MQHVTIPLVGQITSLFPGLTGWHELHISGNATLAQAEAEAIREFPGAAPPTTSVKTAVGQQVTSQVGANPLTGLAAIGDFFQRLTQKSTWVRVGEVGLGGILLYAGVRALSHGSAVAGSSARASATRPVKKVTRKAASVVVPEARLATRVVAKRAAPKTTARVAAHRARVQKYGSKTPYRPPAPRPTTVRVSHVYHHKGPKKP